MVGNEPGIIGVEKAEGAVVERQPEDRHVVGVEHAVGEAYGLPLRDQPGRSGDDVVEQLRVPVPPAAKPWKMSLDDIVGQSRQIRFLTPIVKHLEGTEADMGRRQSKQHGAGFHPFTPDFLVAPHHRKGAGRRDAQARHRLAAQVFPDGRAQDRPAVSKLRDVDPELVAGIQHGQRLAGGHEQAAAEASGEFRSGGFGRVETDERRRVRVEAHQIGRFGKRRGLMPGIKGLGQ